MNALDGVHRFVLDHPDMVAAFDDLETYSEDHAAH